MEQKRSYYRRADGQTKRLRVAQMALGCFATFARGEDGRERWFRSPALPLRYCRVFAQADLDRYARRYRLKEAMAIECESEHQRHERCRPDSDLRRVVMRTLGWGKSHSGYNETEPVWMCSGCRLAQMGCWKYFGTRKEDEAQR